MRLSKRIYALRDAVNIGESVADIGTDHGYVPMLLVRDEISPYVIMSDISNDSLTKAVDTFNQVGIPCDNNQFRVGDGLSTIDNGEVDDIIIAGLGGHTIVDILSEDINKTRSFKRLILQPRKHSGALRYWLYTNSFSVENEILTSEGKFICEIITAYPSNKSSDYIPYSDDDIRWSYPTELKNSDADLLRIRLDWKLNSIKEQIESLRASNKDNSEKIHKLENDYKYLESLIQ